MATEKLVIDPGFVHRRSILTLLQEEGTAVINQKINQISPKTPESQKEVFIDRIHTDVLTDFCKENEIKPLQDLLLQGQHEQLFYSIVNLKACKDIYDKDRAMLKCEPFEGSGLEVELHITTSRVTATTIKEGLFYGGEFAVVAQYFRSEGNRAIFHPLLIGLPRIQYQKEGYTFYKKYSDSSALYIDDFEEFSRVNKIEQPASFKEMREIKEKVFKAALGKILCESTYKDWGGETSDFVTSHLHVEGQRVRAAFLLKGPTRFSPMTVKHLGKNGDQISRLAKEPAEVLIVQHCHTIPTAIVDMLKAFATQPSNPRRYCIIDGRDSLRLLEAYDLKEWALSESKKDGNRRQAIHT